MPVRSTRARCSTSWRSSQPTASWARRIARRCSPPARRASRAAGAEPTGNRLVPAQADFKSHPAARRARGDAAVRRARRATAVPPAVVGEAGRRPSVSGGAARWLRGRAHGAGRGPRLQRRVRRPRRAPRGRRPRLPGRGARDRTGGHARGLRARRTGGRDRRDRLGQVRGTNCSSASSIRRRCRERLDELDEPAAVLVPAHRLDACFFNIEFFVPDDGPAQIVELNPRIASQFSPLVEAVHGRPTYEALFPSPAGRSGAGGASRTRRHLIRGACVRGRARRGRSQPQDGLEILVRPGSGCPSKAPTTR